MKTTTNAPRQRHRFPDKGAILMVVLIVLIALLGLGMTGLFLTSGSIQMNTNINLRNQALLVAEAGIERAKQVLNNPAAIPSLPTLLAGSNPTTGDAIPKGVDQCDGKQKPGAILMDATTPLLSVDYPSLNRNTDLPSGVGTITRQTMGQYTVYIRQDQADCRMENFICDNAPVPDGVVDPGACLPPDGKPTPNHIIIVRSEGVASDRRTRVVLEVTMAPSQGQNKVQNTPLSALCAAGASGCDDNASVQNGIVVNSNNEPTSVGGAAGGGAGGASGSGGVSGSGGAIVIGTGKDGGVGGASSAGGATGAGGSTGCTTNPTTPALVPQCIKRKVPDVLIVLDQSGSMNQTNQGVLGSSPYSDGRWATYVVPIIKYELDLTEAGLAWGLLKFPNDQSDIYKYTPCTPDPGPAVDTVNHIVMVNPTCKVNNATAIKSQIPAYAMGLGTPTDNGIRAATDYLTHLSDGNSHYILLATDGTPVCYNGYYCYVTSDNPHCTITARQSTYNEITNALNHNISTYVVGINTGGDQVSHVTATAMNDALNRMATLGGTAQAACPTNDTTGTCHAYYPADDQSSLTDALNKIVSKLNSCIIPLTAAPPDYTKVGVGINDGYGTVTQIFQKGHGDNSTDGYWDYTDSNKTSITLGGNACNQLAQGTCGCVEIFFGCASVPVIPTQGGSCP